MTNLKVLLILFVAIGSGSGVHAVPVKCQQSYENWLAGFLPGTPVGEDLKPHMVTCEDCTSTSIAISNIYGSGPYHIQTAMCIAAVHYGVITLAGGTRDIVLTKLKDSVRDFPGSTRNGITSKTWGTNLANAFSVAASTGGGGFPTPTPSPSFPTPSPTPSGTPTPSPAPTPTKSDITLTASQCTACKGFSGTFSQACQDSLTPTCSVNPTPQTCMACGADPSSPACIDAFNAAMASSCGAAGPTPSPTPSGPSPTPSGPSPSPSPAPSGPLTSAQCNSCKTIDQTCYETVMSLCQGGTPVQPLCSACQTSPPTDACTTAAKDIVAKCGGSVSDASPARFNSAATAFMVAFVAVLLL